MLETKYGLKYSMPHSVVHIVDNSMYQGELPTIVTDDPSLYSTIVVSGAPMGADNEIISINRSDVLNVAYGMSSLTAGDIKKFGQTVTYPSAILAQDAPIKFMRVTPPDATYAFSCLLIQWRWDGSTMHVRFKTTSGNGNNGLPPGIVHASFKNPARLNATLVRMNALDEVTDDTSGTTGTWKQRVFMTSIAAGRGKIYDFYNYAINQTQQSKRPANVRYMFSTIDTRISQTVERFYASLINENNGNRADAIESVNVQVGQRIKGSSIIIPTINEDAVQELYNEYMIRMKEMIDSDVLPVNSDSMKWVTDVYKTMTINIFDPIYGRYIYNGDTDVKLPYFQVDMFDLDIPKLDTANKLTVAIDASETISDYINDPIVLNDKLNAKTYAVTNPADSYHVGDLFITNTATRALTLITSVNQYTGSITSVPISQVWVTKPTTEQPQGTKDMFSAFISLDGLGDDPKTKISKQVADLIEKRKLIVRTDSSTSATDQNQNYMPDYVLVEDKNTINDNNRYTTFCIAKIPYESQPKSSTTNPRIDTENIVIYDSKDDENGNHGIYNLIVYPSSKITSFATDAEDEYYKTPGSTFIDTTRGIVYVNGYSGYDTATDTGRYVVANSDKPFFVGSCPSSFSVSNNLMNTSYDLLIYKDSTELPVDWQIVGGTAVPNCGTGYKVGDVVTISAGGGASANFRVASVDDTQATQNITVEFAQSLTSQSSKVEPDEYTVATKDVYELYAYATAVYEPNVYYSKDSEGNYTLLTGEDAPTGWGTEGSEFYTKRTTSGLKINVEAADIKEIIPTNVNPTVIKRYLVTGTQGSLFRYQLDPTEIPSDYYSPNYGENPSSELGGLPIENGYAGFFDDDISEIEFKWRYSELLVKAYRGYIDPRIKSTTRCPAKYLFDGGTNTIVGQTILPYMVYKPIDLINASTIYTDDEKEAILLNNDLIANIKDQADIDVKQAMYDLMEYRCYQGIPEDKRPIGPGSGLSLHLDSGVTDANTAMLINTSFNKRFNNPNASWDIGGYVSAADGVSYTFVKALVDNMFAHLKRFSVNKPFTGKYTNIPVTDYTSFFPDLELDVDSNVWEEREFLYNSGGNAWMMDVNGNLQRKSQRTLYREDGTSDLIQENNMRTLSQLTYLLQNKIDSYLLEYNDDGVLKTLKDDVDNMFSNWVGNLVQKLQITFERDINPLDGGEIVVCYCNVTFRGLILRVPIIVNVQRRTDSQ